MKKNHLIKNILISLIFALGILFLSNNTSKASESLYLENLDFAIQINSDGSMDVTETWDINIEDTNTLFKTFKTDSSKYSGIENVKVIEVSNGQKINFNKIDELMYHVTDYCYYGLENSDGDFEIAWGTGMENDRGNKTYKISYTVEDAIGKYNDYSELYWQFIGEDFSINAEKITGTIYLPSDVQNKEDIRLWGHTEELNGTINAQDTHTIKFDLTGFRSGRFVKIRTLFPTELISYSGRNYNKEILENVIEEETVWANEANERRKENERNKLIIGIIVILISAVIDIRLIKKHIKIKRENNSKTKKFKPTQILEYFREIPREDSTPAESKYMITKKIKEELTGEEMGKIFSATLLDLSLNKLISLDTKDKIQILNNEERLAELTKDERAIYNFIKGVQLGKEFITIKELEKYIRKNPTEVIRLKQNVEKIVPAKLIEIDNIDNEEKERYKKASLSIILNVMLFIFTIVAAIVFAEISNKIYIIGIISVMICQILNIFANIKILTKINVYTQKGIDEAEQWKGLKKYMEDFSMLDKREIPEIVIWEKFLVYATAFGIADKVLKQLKIVYPDFENMADINTATYMTLMLTTDFSNSFSNSISNAMSSSYSSGIGGGGGFSGGGGGGRRPEVGGGGR